MNRRQFLANSAAIPAAALSGCSKLSFEQGFLNECRAPGTLPRDAQELRARAWEGIRPDHFWDVHVHLFGNGQSGQGIWINPDWEKPMSPVGRARRVFFANAACGGEDDEHLDQGMVRRLTQVTDDLPPGAKVMLLAFDFTYDESGKQRKDLSAFSIPNEYAARVARARPDRFEWIASVHPYRTDAIEALEAVKRQGARAIKWLPPAMGIDPSNPRCAPYYDALKRLDLPLLAHVGEEQAVKGAERHPFGNPLHMRHPLERGARVIAAHCATLGESPDIDRERNPDKAPATPNIDLFARLMGERKYEGLLVGDLAAVTQINRAESLPRLLERREWHGRLLNGSDYPLPGVMPIFSLSGFVRAGLLDEQLIPALRELRHVNPLAFDFTLKRSLSYRGSKFANAAFETRDFFGNWGQTPN